MPLFFYAPPGWRNGPDSSGGRGIGLSARGGSASGGKSQLKVIDSMNLDDLQSAVGVYVLLGNGGAYMYKGSAHDLRKRVTDHIQGRVARTRNRRPLVLIHIEYIADYTEARRRENWLKSGQGRKWLKERYAWVAEWQTHRT